MKIKLEDLRFMTSNFLATIKREDISTLDELIGKVNEKISVEIIQSPFEADNEKGMNIILSAVFAKIASLNLGYARAVVLEPNENQNAFIDVYLKKE